MLKAKKSRWFEFIFSVYNRHLLKRRFQSLQISGLEFLRRDGGLPIIIYANHSSWWDGLVLLEVFRKLEFEIYVMMEEKQLRKLFLFRRLGAFSVIRENPREAVKSLTYAVELLKEKRNRVVIIFPQGKILPNDVRPISFYRGLAKIIEKTEKCIAIPVALRYEFLGNFKPEIYARFGKPDIFEVEENSNTKSITFGLEKRLTETLDNLKFDVVSQATADYETIF